MVGPVVDGDSTRLLPAIAVAVCWGVLIVMWVAGAVYNARKAPAARERRRLGPAWLLGIAGYAVLSWVVPEGVWAPLTVDADWVPWAGVALLAGCTAFTLWARAALGTMWTSSAVVKEGHLLRT